jgi:Domain of unknown function (DUF4476)
MKKSLLIAFALVLCVKVFAQVTSNVILFTENGERFYAILNGQRMNDEPVTNLKVQQLNQPNYALKVIFENKTIGEMNKTLYVESGVEAVYAVKLDKKAQYKLAFRSSVPIAQAAPPAPQQQVVYWGVAPVIGVTTTTTGTTGTTGTTMTTGVPVGTTTTVQEQTTTTTTTGTGMNTNVNTGTGENVSMNVNTNGFGMNVSINTTGSGVPATTSGVSTTTTTTTTTTGTTGTQPVIVSNPQPVIVQPAPCTHMGASDFNSALSSIKAKSFEDSKLTLAKQITSRNCLDATQVKMVTDLMPFESSKLEYAKYAYDFCWEKNNYFKVNDAFEFESTIEELDAYIQSR